MQVLHHRPAALLPNPAAFVRAQAVDLALEGKEEVDALHRLECDRRHGRGTGAAARSGDDVGQLEEAAAGVPPAERRRDRPARTPQIIKPVVAAIGVGLQDAPPASQSLFDYAGQSWAR